MPLMICSPFGAVFKGVLVSWVSWCLGALVEIQESTRGSTRESTREGTRESTRERSVAEAGRMARLALHVPNKHTS